MLFMSLAYRILYFVILSLLLIDKTSYSCDCSKLNAPRKRFHLYQHANISTMTHLARFRHGGNNMADMGNRWEGMQFVNTTITVCCDSSSI